MKHFSRLFKGIFKNGLAYIFLAASLCVYAIILDWSKIFTYISHFGDANCQPVKKEAINFVIYDMSPPPIPSPFEILEALFYFLSFPSALIKEILVTDLKTQYAHWCPETFDIIGIVSFLIINSFYWLFLGYLIETTHDYYKKNKTESRKTFQYFRGFGIIVFIFLDLLCFPPSEFEDQCRNDREN